MLVYKQKYPFSAFVAVVVALASLLAGCSSAPSASPSGTGGGTRAVSFGLPGVPPIFLNTVMEVAKDKGLFAKRNVEVTLRPLPTGADVGRAVQSGELDGGLIGTPGAVALRAAGGSVVGIMGFPTPTYLLASTDASVSDCKSMKGKTVAVDALGAPKALALTSMLASCGLAKNDVSTINVGGPPTVDALVNGQVTLAVLHPDELATVRAKAGKEVKQVMTLAQVDPLAHYTTVVTLKKELDDATSRQTWVDVVAALHEAIAYMSVPANAGEVAAIAAKMTGRTPQVSEEALKGFLTVGVWPKDDGLGRPSIEHTIEEAVAAGNIPKAKAPTYEQMIDTSVFADAVKG
jgi:NitT/TauT family transport system substrate-binding protein